MSQTKCPKLTVRQRAGTAGITTGANVQVELDGVPLRSLYFLKIDLHARRVCRVTMEMYVELDVEVNIDEPKKTGEKATGLKVGDKHVALYQLSNYSPKVIATKK